MAVFFKQQLVAFFQDGQVKFGHVLSLGLGRPIKEQLVHEGFAKHPLGQPPGERQMLAKGPRIHDLAMVEHVAPAVPVPQHQAAAALHMGLDGQKIKVRLLVAAQHRI